MFCHFGETVARLCREHRVSRTTLRRQLGLSARELAEIEQAAWLPAETVVERLACVFGMSSDELLLTAGALPTWLEKALLSRPGEVVQRLRSLAEDRDSATEPSSPPPHVAPPVVLETGLGRLHHGDCVRLLRGLPDESVDLFFADPPFNLGKDYGEQVDDGRPEQGYIEWSRTWMAEAVRVLKPGGSLFLYNIPRWSIHLASWLARFLQFRHWVAVDIKFSLPIQQRLYPSHYSLLYYCKGRQPNTFSPPRLPIETCRHCGGEIRDYGGYKDRMNPRGVNLTDVWTDISPVRHARFKRRQANELPLKMLDRILDIASAEGDIVLDPFGGSGTTYVAAELKGRRWIGCELGDCQPILDRFENIDREREILAKLRGNINTLFTPASLVLRRRNGHDTSRYRLENETAERQPVTALPLFHSEG